MGSSPECMKVDRKDIGAVDGAAAIVHCVVNSRSCTVSAQRKLQSVLLPKQRLW